MYQEDDELRALYDSLCIGSLSTTHSFQSKVVANTLFHSDEREQEILLQIQKEQRNRKLLSRNSSTTFEESSVQVNSQNIFASLLQNLSKEFDSSSSSQQLKSLSDTFNFADDLILLDSYESVNKGHKHSQQNSILSTNTEQDKGLKRPISVIESSAINVTQKSIHATDISNQEVQSTQVRKANPFVSARDKYVEEGHQFTSKSYKPASAENISRNNTNTKGLDQSSNHKAASNEDSILIDKIEADIIVKSSPVSFDDIAGLEFAKKCVQELIVWPMTRPDLFKGLRAVPRGILLFGPPGTGKTLIGKAISHSCAATFFNISASSLTSKWIGEGEKTVRILFELANQRQPSVIFIDEVDSLLSVRTSDENEASRRMKTEFLVQLDGAGTDASSRVVVIGATNRPEELDEGARRRFVKRLYIPLPDEAGRRQLIERLLVGCANGLTDDQLYQLVIRTKGFSGSDMRSLCTEAAMGPVRAIICRGNCIASIRENDVLPISFNDFVDALDAVAPSVSDKDLIRYVEWNSIFGSYRKME